MIELNTILWSQGVYRKGIGFETGQGTSDNGFQWSKDGGTNPVVPQEGAHETEGSGRDLVGREIND